MLSWTIQITVISIILIFLVHHLIQFFKDTLTVPKIKDLVNTPIQKYENMMNVMNRKTKYLPNNSNTVSLKHDFTEIDLLPNYNDASMKNELKSFLKSQLNNSSTNANTNISNINFLDISSNANTFTTSSTVSTF